MKAEAPLIADFAFATAFSLLLPLPELQDAAKKQLAERSQNLQLQSCPALMTLLVSKNLLPGLVSSACFPQICKQLLDNTNGMKIRRDIEFPAALAQLVLSQNMVSKYTFSLYWTPYVMLLSRLRCAVNARDVKSIEPG